MSKPTRNPAYVWVAALVMVGCIGIAAMELWRGKPDPFTIGVAAILAVAMGLLMRSELRKPER